MKRRYILISLIILSLPLLIIGLVWEHLPLQLPMHFTMEGKPDRFGTRAHWFGMLVSTTLFLTAGFRILIYFLPHRLALHHVRMGAVYLISAVFIACLIGVLILKTVFVTTIYSDLLPVLLTLFVSGFVYFSLPSFMPLTHELKARNLTTTSLQVLQKTYRLSRSVVVRVNALIALAMLAAKPDDRWSIMVLANLLAMLVLSVLVSHTYRKATKTP